MRNMDSLLFYINIHLWGGCFAFHIAKHEIMHHTSLLNCTLFIFMQHYVQLSGWRKTFESRAQLPVGVPVNLV